LTLNLTGAVAGTNFIVEAGSALSNQASNPYTINIGSTANQLSDLSGTLNWFGGTFTVANTGTAVATVSSAGVINHFGGTITSATVARLVFESGATYNYLGTSTALTVPLATWNDGSQVNITGVTSGIPAGLTQNFGNVLWDCSMCYGIVQANLEQLTLRLSHLVLLVISRFGIPTINYCQTPSRAPEHGQVIYW